jgi:hypothetical protein
MLGEVSSFTSLKILGIRPFAGDAPNVCVYVYAKVIYVYIHIYI